MIRIRFPLDDDLLYRLRPEGFAVLDSMSSLIGETRRYVADADEYRRVSPIKLLADAREPLPALYVSNGLYDAYGDFEGSEALARMAIARGVQTEWRQLYGGHCATDITSLARFLVSAAPAAPEPL